MAEERKKVSDVLTLIKAAKLTLTACQSRSKWLKEPPGEKECQLLNEVGINNVSMPRNEILFGLGMEILDVCGIICKEVSQKYFPMSESHFTECIRILINRKETPVEIKIFMAAVGQIYENSLIEMPC